MRAILILSFSIMILTMGQIPGATPYPDEGQTESWMTDDGDLDGNPRIVNGTVEMGAYEELAPEISVNPTSLSATVTMGKNAPPQSFEVWNSGGETLSYSIADKVTWLSGTPTSGTSTGEHDSITVNYNTSELGMGTYSATIAVSDPNASNTPQLILVALTVTEPEPEITVTVPKGGEVWQRGELYDITWSWMGDVGTNVKIELYKGGVFNSTIVDSTPNDGIHPWSIPSDQAEGSDYTVEITSMSNPSCTDSSDGYFSVIDRGLVGHWKFDETSGASAYDSSGNGNHGIVLGNPQWVAGKVGGGLNMDGMDDYVVLPIGSLIGSLTDSTFATWVNFSNAGGLWQRIFDFGSGTTYNMFLTPRADAAGPMRFAITISGPDGEEQATAPSKLPSGWRHVAVTINGDANTIRLYLDGVVVAENTATTLTPSDLGNTTQNWLGRSQYSGDAHFDGVLDDFRIYSRALSAGDIQEMFGISQPPDIETGLVAHYPCDEGEGNIVQNVVEDTIGEDGQVNGLGYEWVEGKVGDSAILFKGENLTVVDCGTYDPSEGTGELTVAAWIQWEGLNGEYQGVVAKGDEWTVEDTCWQMELDRDTGNIAFTRYDNYPDFGANILSVGEWQHVAVTFDGTTTTMYIDGFGVGTSTTFSFGPKTDAHVVFGAVDGSGNNAFNGAIDDVRIYSRALSAVDVQELFNTRPPDIETGLVGHWKFDETSGDTAYDSSGNENHGTLIGDPEWVTGKVGGALQFDGYGDYVDCGTGHTLAVQDAITISCWIKVDSWTKEWETILAKGDGSYRMSRAWSGEATHFGITSTDFLDGSIAVADNQWHLITDVYDGATYRIHVDGVLDTSFPYAVPIGSSSYPLYIGENSQNGGRYITGLIDDVRIYDRALSAGDVQELFKIGQPPDIDTGLVGHWKLDEAPGETAYDSSGNDNHGTVFGNPQWTAGKVGGGLEFDGDGDYVQVARVVQDDFTLAAWIKADVPGRAGSQAYEGSGLIWSDVSGMANDFILAVLGTKLSFFCGNPDTSVNSDRDVVTGDWVHVVATRSAQQQRTAIYVDGQFEGTADHANPGPLDALPTIAIGGNVHDSRYYTGLIDDVRMYNRVLSVTDVQELFKSRPPRISQVLAEATGAFQLTWTSLPRKKYIIWSCTDLSSGDWTNEAGVRSTSESTSWADPNPSGSRKFYRVEQF